MEFPLTSRQPRPYPSAVSRETQSGFARCRRTFGVAGRMVDAHQVSHFTKICTCCLVSPIECLWRLKETARRKPFVRTATIRNNNGYRIGRYYTANIPICIPKLTGPRTVTSLNGANLADPVTVRRAARREPPSASTSSVVDHSTGTGTEARERPSE